MTDAILRQWTILEMIPREPATITTSEIHRRLSDGDYEVTLRTIQRDLLKLEEIFPLRQAPGFGTEKIWYWPRTAKGLSVPGMAPQAALAFKLVDEYLRPLLPKSTLSALAPYLETAEGVLAQAGIPALARWPEKVSIIPRGQPLLPPELDENVLAVVYEALFRERRFHAHYRPAHNPEGRDYVFNPLGLVFRDGVIYLVTALWDYPDIKQFALHRMDQAELLDEPVKAVEGFDLDGYIRRHAFEYPVADEPAEMDLELLLQPALARHLEETRLSLDQLTATEPDGRVRLTATVANTAQLRWWLLGFGNGVEVVKPAELNLELLAASRREPNDGSSEPSTRDMQPTDAATQLTLAEEIMNDHRDVLSKLAQ